MKYIIAILAACVLAACVTTSERATGDPEASRSEAAKFNLQLGIGYFRQGNLDAARDKLRKSVEQDPDLATTHMVLGLVYERLEDPAEAEKEYRRAVSLDSEDPDALNALAVFLCSQKVPPEPAESLKLFDRAIAIPLSRKTANRPMLYTNAGTCAKKTDPVRAENYFRAALADDPKFPDALLQLAENSLDSGNALQARAFLQRYLAVAKPSASVLVLGVRIEDALGDAAAGRRYREQLQKEFPESVEARALQGRGKG